MYGQAEVDDETEKKLSLLLKYYRKRASLNQRDFITYNEATICSADTYSKIENCKIIKSSSTYHYLLIQIHAELNLPSSWWEPWSTCFRELLGLMTCYDLAGLAERCAVLFVQPQKETDIFAVEYQELLILMAFYYGHCSETSGEQSHKYMELLPIFDMNIQEILKNMLYTYTIRRHRDARKNGAVFTRLHMAESTSLLNILDRSYQAYYEECFLGCSRDSLCLEQIFLKQGNYNRLLDVYDVIILLYTDMQGDTVNHEYVERLLVIVNEHSEQLYRGKYPQSLYQCGMLYYEVEQYGEACDYFCELAKQGDYHFLPTALLACALCKKLECVIPPEILQESRYSECFLKHVIIYHQYHRFKQEERDPFQREEYFLKYMPPQISNEDQLIQEPACRELGQLIQPTRHYHLKKRIQSS